MGAAAIALHEVGKAGPTADTRNMGWRRKPRAINEELLAQTTREAEVEEQPGKAKGRFRRLAVYVLAGLLFIGLKEGVRFLPAWVGIVIGINRCRPFRLDLRALNEKRHA